MSEHELSCPVVRDLLPLYHDRVVEEETAALVEAHLEGCPDCQAVLTRLRGELPEVAVPVDDQASAELVRREKTGYGAKTVIATVVTLVVGLILWIGIVGYFPVIPVDPNAVIIESVENTEEMCFVRFYVDTPCWGNYTSVDKDPESDTVYIVIRDTPFRFWGEKGGGGACGASFHFDDQEPIRQIICNGEVIWSAEEDG